MGTHHGHLGLEDRERIAIFKERGYSLRRIGQLLGKSHATISRELRRNAPPIHAGYYLPHRAHQRARERKQRSGERPRLKTPWIRCHVETKLKLGWSPEQIAKRLPESHPEWRISTEAIYQYIYEESPHLIGYLTRRHRQRQQKGHSRKHRRSHIPNRVSILERPARVERRKEFGHWETDSVVSSRSLAALNVLVERRSRYVKITWLPQKSAHHTRVVINRRLSHHAEGTALTITYDNGSENVEHEQVNEVMGIRSFFCQPFHSWEKGTVENSIGLIRRFIPKGTDLAMLSPKQIRLVESRLNNRPRKCLNYQTPAEVFKLLGGAIAG